MKKITKFCKRCNIETFHRLVSWISNHCRGDLTDNEFITMCKMISKNIGDK